MRISTLFGLVSLCGEKKTGLWENAAQIDYMDYKEYYRKIVSMNNIVSCNIDKMYRHIYRAISKGEHISLF